MIKSAFLGLNFTPNPGSGFKYNLPLEKFR
jgi:hypothetical protein